MSTSTYIRIEDAIDVLRILQDKMSGRGVKAVESCIGAVGDLVEVDAVPVVRCKDCIFSDKKEYKGAGDNIVMFCPNIGAYVGGNWFCADGERKE